eukprot:gnl/TRDRNA2_/TRDRNA2_93656_c0_seq1.p1 gnl/TRDRNA2_/TRDRNA2_93656_c0~~gnl/TRDRNA2_/TRDRNA2_93656_c0_seq1.p1  ORF type:complete len:730 (-),score=130.89 gnl/TRDRNA2_/TRDRNA2_93656_c0_seq1:147-2069(-)
MSAENQSRVLKQVRKFVAGEEVVHPSNPNAPPFCPQDPSLYPVTLRSDSIGLLQKAKEYHDEHGRDTGNGWMLLHPIKKVQLYQSYCRSKTFKPAVTPALSQPESSAKMVKSTPRSSPSRAQKVSRPDEDDDCPQELEPPDGCPPGWQCFKHRYKSGKMSGKSYLRFNHRTITDAQHKGLTSLPAVVKQHAMDTGADADKALEEYEAVKKAKADAKVVAREADGALKGQRREAMIKIYRDAYGPLTTEKVKSFPGWTVQKKVLENCGQTHAIYTDTEANKQWGLLKDIECWLGTRMTNGEDISVLVKMEPHTSPPRAEQRQKVKEDAAASSCHIHHKSAAKQEAAEVHTDQKAKEEGVAGASMSIDTGGSSASSSKSEDAGEGAGADNSQEEAQGQVVDDDVGQKSGNADPQGANADAASAEIPPGAEDQYKVLMALPLGHVKDMVKDAALPLTGKKHVLVIRLIRKLRGLEPAADASLMGGKGRRKQKRPAAVRDAEDDSGATKRARQTSSRRGAGSDGHGSIPACGAASDVGSKARLQVPEWDVQSDKVSAQQTAMTLAAKVAADHKAAAAQVEEKIAVVVEEADHKVGEIKACGRQASKSPESSVEEGLQIAKCLYEKGLLTKEVYERRQFDLLNML